MWDKLKQQKFMQIAAGALIGLLIIQIIAQVILTANLKTELGVAIYERITMKMFDISEKVVMIVLLYFFGKREDTDPEK